MAKIQDINFAIPETKRPPIYTSMKYWGKKPHNVWYEYIKNYTPQNGIYLDTFAGSGMSGIEAVRAGKKAICLDINPLTSFVFDVYCSNYNGRIFEQAAQTIFKAVAESKIYKHYFCYEEGFVLHNTKYNKNIPYEVCFVATSGSKKFERAPIEIDEKRNNESRYIEIKTVYPKKEFRKTSAYSNSFLNSIGKTYDCLFTRKNLGILSLIFEEIIKSTDADVKKQLLFAFIQTVHLCCKMCVPRSKKTKRDYSTSWGRSAYFSSSKSMEMNPLLVFYNNCIGKQSVSSCLSFLQTYVGKIRGKNITNCSKVDLSEDYNLWYGIKDSRYLSNYLDKNVVDFVLTDPPYGGLVPYLDLSNIWLAWLELYDNIYNPNYSDEISINTDKTHMDFRTDMAQVLSQIDIVSKSNAKMVLTFNNKEPRVWKSLLGAILDAGYCVEKVIHQQNLRSGESNVADKYGTSSTDFYLRCTKNKDANKQLQIVDLQKYICDIAEDIILSRAEPTPYQILFNGILTKLTGHPNAFENFDDDLILALKESGRFYTLKNTETLSGNYWWIKGREFDLTNAEGLTNRIKILLQELFRDNNSLAHTELLKIVYKKFPNGLSPDSVVLEKILLEYAERKGELWQKR